MQEHSGQITEIKDNQSDNKTEMAASYLSNNKVDMIGDKEGDECEEFSSPAVQSPDCESLTSCESNESFTPSQDASFYDNLPEGNLDQCAPFIPPPLGDTQFLMSSIDMCSFDGDLNDDNLAWNTDTWEICDPVGPCNSKKEANIRRNLSTPKFFPSEEELPILNSEEIEMSTPVQNLPLLQGNEIWFALDQCKEVVA